MLKKPKAQSTAEYAIIMAVVIGAAVAMQTYVKRGLQARQKTGTDALTAINATFQAEDTTAGGNVDFLPISQYEPYYLESKNVHYQENVEREYMGGGGVKKEKVSDISATKSGSYQMQSAGNSTQTGRDEQWE